MAYRKYLYGNSAANSFYLTEAHTDYRVYAGGGGDYVSGGDGNDYVYGQTGNDFLVDGDGTDLIHGGDDNDWIFAGAGNDRYYGGTGEDMISYSYATSGVRVNLETGSSQSRYYWTDANVGTDTLNGFESVYGSNYGDDITGDAGDNSLFGNGGNDYLTAGAGNDHVYGGSGGDYVYVGTGNDTYDGGSGTDWLLLNTVGHGVNINLSNGTLVAKAGAIGDDAIGSNRISNFEYIYSGQGDDWVNGTGSSHETVYLNLGDDAVLAGGGDTYHGQNGTDTLLFGAMNGVTVNVNSGLATESSTGNTVHFSSFERFSGTDAKDRFYATNIDATYETLGGDDILALTGGTVTADLGDGFDILEIQNADALAVGGNGDDQFTATDSTVRMYGGEDDDRFTMDGSTGSLDGGAGNDTLTVDRLDDGMELFFDGSADDDRIYISGPNPVGLEVDMAAGTAVARDGSNFGTLQFTNVEAIYTNDGDNLINGSDDQDILVGAYGADTLFGNGGDDYVVGGGNNDILSGGDGNDHIEGEDGNDVMTGGAGQDIFEFRDNARADNLGNDRITDFDTSGAMAGGDLLYLGYGIELVDGTDISAVSDLDTNLDGRIGAGDTGFAVDGNDLVLAFQDGTIRLEGVEYLTYDSIMV